MRRRCSLLTAVAVVMSFSSPLAWAQAELERYDFDGVADEDPQPADPTDWMTSVNWADGAGGPDPDPDFRPPIPRLSTRVEIVTSTFGVNAPVIGPDDTAEALSVRIGRSDGEGLLTMTGGTLDMAIACGPPAFNCNTPDRRLRMGNDDSTFLNAGTFNLSGGIVTTDSLWIGSGSHGEMNMSGGVVNITGHLFFDWSFDQGSVLNMTGGTINVGTVLPFPLVMHRASSLNLDGGEILISGAARLGTALDNPDDSAGGQQTPDVTASITDGLLESNDFLQIGGSVVVDGGILRASSFNEADSVGTVEINEGGTLQLNNSQESIADVQNLVTSGFLTTSSPLGIAGFVIEVVDVNGTDFTQVAFAGGVPGDYNGNGVVDAADYTLFRDNLGASFALMNENPAATTPGFVDEEDYDFWVTNFGNSAAAGSGSSAGTTAVPEPASLAFGLMMLAGVALLRRRA